MQPACVHATMDLLKIALKLAPFGPAETLGDSLEVSIASRRLDVAASPYDASPYKLEAIPVETLQGRIEYKEAQLTLMNSSLPVRAALLSQYAQLLDLYGPAPCTGTSEGVREIRVPGSL